MALVVDLSPTLPFLRMTDTRTDGKLHFITTQWGVSKTKELESACIKSVKPDTVRIWISNVLISFTGESPDLIFGNSKKSGPTVYGVHLILDDQVEEFKKLCDVTYANYKIDLFIDKCDFIYENMHSFIVNHRKRFGDITMVKIESLNEEGIAKSLSEKETAQ